MWLGLQAVSLLERCYLFRVSFIERFHCIEALYSNGCIFHIMAYHCMQNYNTKDRHLQSRYLLECYILNNGHH